LTRDELDFPEWNMLVYFRPEEILIQFVTFRRVFVGIKSFNDKPQATVSAVACGLPLNKWNIRIGENNQVVALGFRAYPKTAPEKGSVPDLLRRLRK
jgi:hypothetical protein